MPPLCLLILNELGLSINLFSTPCVPQSWGNLEAGGYPQTPSKGTLSLCTPFFNPPHFPILGEVRIWGDILRQAQDRPQPPGIRLRRIAPLNSPLIKQSLKLKAVHPLSTLPLRLIPGAGSHQVLLRHPEFTIYRCFLPDLTGFIAFCRAGPSVHHRWTEDSPGKSRASSGDSIPL